MESSDSFGVFLKNSFGDRYLYEVNGIAFNQVGATALYENHFGDTFLKETQLYIIVGTDSGLLIDFLKNRQRSDSSRYIFVELDSVQKRLEQEGLLADLPADFSVVTLENLWAQANTFKVNDYLYIDSVSHVNSLCAVDGRLSEYRDLSLKIEDSLGRRKNAVVAEIGLAYFAERQLENLAENQTESIVLKDQFKGKTAVLLAGGPSLDDMLPWVEENRDKFFVLAVSRISRQLLQYDFVPDLVFSVDPQSTSFDVSREMLQMWDRTIFVHAYHASPQLVGQWSGRSLYVGERFPWVSKMNPTNLKVSPPTVTNTALNAAIAMGFKQVILVGVDLCYADNGITHAGGSNESIAGPRLGDTLSIATNDGGQAETGVGYASAISFLSGQAQMATQHGCRLINPNPRAAKIENVEHVSLDEIVLEPLDCDPNAKLLVLLPDSADNQTRQEYYSSVLEELNRADEQLKEIGKLAAKALSYNEKLFKNKKDARKAKAQFEKIEKTLNETFSDLSVFVKKYVIRKFLKIVRPNYEGTESSQEMEEVIHTYYQAYKEGSSDLRKKVQSAAERLHSRLDEENSHPDFARLAEQWQKDKQPGRALVWLKLHHKTAEQLDNADRQLFEKLEAEFSDIMAETETGQMKKVRRFRSLVGVRERAMRYFRAKDEEALKRLDDGLSIHQNRVAADNLGSLVKGLQLELKGDIDGALTHYQALVGDVYNHLTEEALKRILSLALQEKHYEMALLALECLSNAAVVYKPKYAELLRITGNVMAAADAYVAYLEEVPTDLTALIQLGQLYQSMGECQAAQQVFDLVLEQDPKNQTAQNLISSLRGVE
ncbi:Protein of unknown function DUF115 [Malonomonas rubra DSM 5091]|uniref:6-hydroxymethylpterin diphosphokinase MptE-like domain-containing protein n=1 Tax=Malonomonas rubra DSM 5091 TaxID=1122189 RepID=A0A1M6MAJ4_MALRU|nr:6-hydroxymethylpterin diphosphokinase MptE-like protein [Malonomonas rubra]SHJ80410.1 Protein of unknown function DUF115 [Malonomonas rubra DSM 5091]